MVAFSADPCGTGISACPAGPHSQVIRKLDRQAYAMKEIDLDGMKKEASG